MQNDNMLQNEVREVAHGDSNWRPGGLFHFLLVLAFIAAADFLFYRQPLGCTVAGYGVLLLLAVAFCHRGSLWNGPAISIAITLLGLFVAMLEYPGVLPIALGAIGLVSLALTGREGWSADAKLWFQRWLLFITFGWLRWFHESALALSWCKSNLTLKGIGPVLRKWTIPVLLSVVFIVLFTIANPIIESWVTELEDILVRIVKKLPEWPEFQRVSFWFLVGIWAIALFRLETKVHSPTENRTLPESARSSVLDLYIRPDLIVRCLSLFNAVFAVETLLDIIYLWGGAKLPQGMTYATYAHRGAYPLVATALLAALFVLVTFRTGNNTEKMRTARKLVYVWLAQNVFLVISAAWRLNLYIEVYSLTRLRVAAAIWMFLVVLGVIWICWRILAGHSNRWLININVLTLLAVLYVCSFVNFDGMIAFYNVHHCKEITGQGVAIDLAYLRGLGPDSLPALRWLVEKSDDERATMDGQRHIDQLEKELAEQMRNWRGWCYRRHRLARDMQLHEFTNAGT